MLNLRRVNTIKSFFMNSHNFQCNLFSQETVTADYHAKWMSTVVDDNSKLRIDKWLWAARFFKTRSQAGQAVQGGKIHLNGARVKPSKEVTAGDQVEIRKSDQIFQVTIKGINRFRRPAAEARELYEESEESVRNREAQSHLRKLIKAPGSAPAKRPDKRERRKIREFIRKD